MNRKEAEALLAMTPEYVPGACPRCGATTFEEAATKCRPYQMPTGDYNCGSPDEGPNSVNDSGPLYQLNPAHQKLNGYLWGWLAVDAGMTSTPPEWDE